MKNDNVKYKKRIITILLFLQVALIFNQELDTDFEEIPTTNLFENLYNITVEENLESIFPTNECLMKKKEAEKILQQEYGVKTTPDQNQRFILGKCSPVLLVPGIYANRLRIKINCKGFVKETDKFMDSRIFCGDSICRDKDNEDEEFTIFPSLIPGPFSMLPTERNKHAACLGYFMQFFNKKEECPPTGGNQTCLYSDNVRVQFYGSTPETVKESRCGLKAVDNVLASGVDLLDKLVNQGAPKVYHNLIKKLDDMGYAEGFSLAALPYDYRRFTFTNNFAARAFRYQVERLYNNTGKPVMIIAHSYGNLLILDKLIRNQGDKEFLSKIKQFVAMTPPYAGASKLMRVFFKGMKDFNVDLSIGEKKILSVHFDTFGQNMMYKSMPVVEELRPLGIVGKLFKDKKYTKFASALKERFALEKQCGKKICDDDYIKENSKKFTELFPELPSLNNLECKINTRKFLKTNSNSCLLNMYNEGECPGAVLVTDKFHPKKSEIESFCGIRNKSLLYVDADEDESESSLDNLYKEGPYSFEDKNKLKYFIERFNKEYSKEFGGKKIDESYFETKEQSRAKTVTLLRHYKKNSITKDLPVPPVDTILLYTNFIPTSTSFLFNKSSSEEFTKEEVYERGGDGTVPNWSSYLVGMKWLYDKKEQNLPQKLTLVEYCSQLNKGQYGYKEGTNQTFYAIGCDCLTSSNTYKDSTSNCSHAKMLSDGKLIEYLKTLVYDKNDTTGKTKGKENAIKKYNKKLDYLNECNYKLKEFIEME